VLGISGCAGPCVRAELLRASNGISNDGIEWRGTFFGLHPVPVGRVEGDLQNVIPLLDEFLFQNLDDPKKWIAAHVLLSSLHPDCRMPPGPVDAQWNGLTVEIIAGSPPRIDERQRRDIREFWRSKFGARNNCPE